MSLAVRSPQGFSQSCYQPADSDAVVADISEAAVQELASQSHLLSVSVSFLTRKRRWPMTGQTEDIQLARTESCMALDLVSQNHAADTT